MPAIPFKKIIAVSSEDAVHKASNLLCPSAGLHWFSSSLYRSKCLTVEIELAKLSKIAQIEVGNLRSAFVEVLVSCTDPNTTTTNTTNTTTTTVNATGNTPTCNSISNSSSSKVNTGSSTVYTGNSITGYVSLLPQSMLMTAEESKNGRNTTRTKVFNLDRLSRTALDKKWKYIKIQCLQPYSTDKPYGLRYIKLFQTNTSDQKLHTESEHHHASSITLSPRLFNTPQHAKSYQSSPVSTSNKRGHLSAPAGLPRTPRLPSLSSYRGDALSNTTPKRPKREQDINDSQEFEFAGLEKQSRLLRNTLKGNNEELLNSNPILNRIAQDKKEKEEKQEIENSGTGGYVRRKLLHKELESVSNKGIDFMSSYDDEKSASWERSKTARIYSAMKIGQLDNSCEMGEEEDNSKWFKGKRKRRDKPTPVPAGKWFGRERGGKGKKTRKNSSSTLLEIPLLLESKQSNLLDYYSNCSSLEEKAPKEDTDDVICTVEVNDATSNSSACSKTRSDESRYEMCPICNELIPAYALELHANDCAEKTFDNSTTTSDLHVNSMNTSKVSQKRRTLGVVYLD